MLAIVVRVLNAYMHASRNFFDTHIQVRRPMLDASDNMSGLISPRCFNILIRQIVCIIPILSNLNMFSSAPQAKRQRNKSRLS